MTDICAKCSSLGFKARERPKSFVADGKVGPVGHIYKLVFKPHGPLLLPKALAIGTLTGLGG